MTHTKVIFRSCASGFKCKSLCRVHLHTSGLFCGQQSSTVYVNLPSIVLKVSQALVERFLNMVFVRSSELFLRKHEHCDREVLPELSWLRWPQTVLE